MQTAQLAWKEAHGRLASAEICKVVNSARGLKGRHARGHLCKTPSLSMYIFRLALVRRCLCTQM